MNGEKNGNWFRNGENAKIVDMAIWESKANSRGINNTANCELSDNRFSAINYCTQLLYVIIPLNYSHSREGNDIFHKDHYKKSSDQL